MTDQPFDVRYWGPDGIDISRWDKFHCRRGCDYHEVGAPTRDGQAGTVRKISTGRKKNHDGKRGHGHEGCRMTIPSEFDLIQIERRADLLESLAAELDQRRFRGGHVLRQVASDMELLLCLVRELREGGRVSSAR